MSEEYLPTEDGQTEEESYKTPFTFKLMIVLTVAYLGWRLVEGIVWLFERITG